MTANDWPAKRILAVGALGLLGVLTGASMCGSPDKPAPPPVTVTQTVTQPAPPPPPPPAPIAPTTGATVPDVDRPHVDAPNIHRPHKPKACRYTTLC